MPSEDPIPLDQGPMQSLIGVVHSGGYVLLVPCMTRKSFEPLMGAVYDAQVIRTAE